MEIDAKQNMGIQKRAERITSAIFLVSNVMSDSEILKTKIRQLGLELVSNSLFLKSQDAPRFYGKLSNLNQNVAELISFLNITSVSGAVSLMNASLLKNELELLLKDIEGLQVSWGGGSNVSEEFFKDNESPAPVPMSVSAVRPVSLQEKTTRKDHRTKAILSVIEKRGEVSIKDISTSVKGFSEKTVQRELNTLIASGVVKKTGERRWSRYSLA